MWRLSQSFRASNFPLNPSLRNLQSLSAGFSSSENGLARGTSRSPLRFSVGEIHNGFRVEHIEEFPVYQLTAFEFVHERLGSKYIHLDSSETNNAFMVSFRTPPKNSTGVAHILEHTVLCGSERFPVRDPFFAMLKRSLNTFMNAMTAPEHTMYPFSTQNAQDYQNLLSVYLDSAFFPLIRKLDFLQEGHRLDFDENGKLVFKGVVYNEMKGAMSDSASIFFQELQSYLFPSTTYHFNSGGDPREITDLTFEQLKEFHAVHYHPSNALFYSFGDLPPPLEFIDRFVLQKFNRIDSSITSVPSEIRYSKPIQVEVSCPVDPLMVDPEKQTTYAQGYLCDPSNANVEETMAMKIMSMLLIDGPNSPMFKALLKPNYGSEYAPGTGYYSGFKDSTFVVGLQHMKDDELDLVKNTIQNTIEEVYSKGFDLSRIDAVVHQVELESKRVNPKFGLQLGFRAANSFVLGSDVFLPLRLPELVSSVQNRVKGGERVFENLLEKHILSNNHKVEIVMRPSEEYLNNLSDFELKKLRMIETRLTEEEKEEINLTSELLAKDQKRTQNLDCLPSLSVTDISEKGNLEENFNFSHKPSLGKSFYFSEQPTNDILYLRTAVDVKKLDNDLEDSQRLLLPIYSLLVTEMGAGTRDHMKLAEFVELKTGGISARLSNDADASKITHVRECLLFRSMSLRRNIQDMLSILDDIIFSPKFDNHEHMKTILLSHAAGLSNALQDSGHRFAMSYAAALTGSHLAIRNELIGGLTQVKVIKDLTASENVYGWISSQLEKIASKIQRQGIDRLIAIGDQNCLSDIEELLPTKLLATPRLISEERVHESSRDAFSFSSPADKSNFFVSLPIQVNHAAMCIPTVPFSHEDGPRLRVLAKLMSSCFLHREIREKGGAYGSGASQSMDGLFSFYSFRDPNCDQTVSAFKRSVEWASGKLENEMFTEKDIEEALLGLFSNIDSPKSPGERGMEYFLSGLTKEQAILYRQRLLQVNRDSLVDVAQRYLLPFLNTDNFKVVVVGRDNHCPVGKQWSKISLDSLNTPPFDLNS